MYKYVTLIALFFVSVSIRAQNRHVLDSLNVALSKAVTDTGRVHTLIAIADEYTQDNTYLKLSPDSADIYLKQASELNKKHYNIGFQNAINIMSAVTYCHRNPNQDPKKLFLPLIDDCRKSADKLNEIMAWDRMALLTERNDQTSLFRLNCYQHALSLSGEVKDGQREMLYLKNIADIHFQQRKFDMAEGELLQILKDPKKAGSANVIGANDLLTALYTFKAEYNKALFYALKVIKIMQMTGDSTYALTYYSRLSALYSILGDAPSALHWSKIALASAIARKTLVFIYWSSGHIVRCLLEEGKAPEALKFIQGIKAKYPPLNESDKINLYKALGDCYYALKENALAESSYLKMISSTPQKFDTFSANWAMVNSTIGIFYLNTKQYAKARTHLLQALKGFKTSGRVDFIESTHLSLFRIDSALGNYPSAIAHLQEGSKLRDSMFNVAKNKQIEELQIQYQTAEKDKNLKLAQNQAKLEQIALEHTKNTRNWIIAGSGLLLIIAGLLYRQGRLRKRTSQIVTRKNEVITQKNEQLQRLVTEKEWLLKEVHHRVKNNLHTVICLLESQAAYLENDALKAIENSEHRIYAMSLIHQKLYQSENIKTIDMSAYIPELVQSLEDSFGTSNQIKFKLKIDPVNLSLSHAIPLGLIINEAVTNSIKYAFPGNRRGEISISMVDNGKQIILELADNGIGMPQIDFGTESKSLGLELMKGLSKDIEADINFKVDNGTKITVLIKDDALSDVHFSESNLYEETKAV